MLFACLVLLGVLLYWGGESFVLWFRRFETLEPEMNNLASRVADVNQVTEQLLKSDNCNKEQINRTQDQLNDRCTHTHTLQQRAN